MRKDTLYITDLDGTLLNNDSVISNRAASMINELSLNGAMISFATARTPATVCDIFKGVVLNVPGVVMTGAALYSLTANEYLFPKFIEPRIVSKAINIFERNKLKPFIYTWRDDNLLHAFHSSGMNGAEAAFYEIRRDRTRKTFHLDEPLSDDDLNHTLLMFCVDARNTLTAVASELEEVIGYKPSYYNDIFHDGMGYLEVFAKGVDKASATKELAAIEDAKRIVAFGDNLNDLPMLEVADVSVAVKNAYPEVLEKADVVIGGNNDDSVVKWIYNDFYSDELD